MNWSHHSFTNGQYPLHSFGSRKFNRDQISAGLLTNAVPDITCLFFAFNLLMFTVHCDLRFLILCASSSAIMSHSIFSSLSRRPGPPFARLRDDAFAALVNMS